MKLLTKKDIKITIVISLIATSLALGIVFTIYFINQSAKIDKGNAVQNLFSEQYQTEKLLDIKLQDLALPDERNLNALPKRFFYREKKEIWTREEIDKYWFSIKEIGIKTLEKQNEAILEKKIMP